MKKRIAILASGSGTNAEAIARYFADSYIVEVALLIASRNDAGALQRMKQFGIQTIALPKPEWTSPERGGYGGANALRLLAENNIDLIVLAGFLPFVPKSILKEYEGRILNIHPSLLPRHGGKGMWGHHVHEAVIANGDTESGITIHLVTEEVDGGKPLFQARCDVYPHDTPDTLEARIHTLEHLHYPRVIEKFLLPQS